METHSPRMPDESEVRRLVRRIVDAREPEASSAAAETTLPASAATTAGFATTAIAIGADHGGYALKQKLKAYLGNRGFAVHDCGTSGTETADYPEFAHAVARRVADGACRWGILVDGAGIGSCIVANKVPGVRAALCYDISSARNSREHNHANVLTLGAGLVGENLARQIVDTWLATAWGTGRHARRVELIGAIERRYLCPEVASLRGSP